jgi:hypothetical protein
MTKILLVEKRYNRAEANPSVTAKWIEIPEGEEGLFLAEQLSYVDEIEPLQLQEMNHKAKKSLSSEDIVTIFTYGAFIVAVPFAYFIYHLAPRN